jgi:cell wall-associated NlpC family hydrolase
LIIVLEIFMGNMLFLILICCLYLFTSCKTYDEKSTQVLVYDIGDSLSRRDSASRAQSYRDKPNQRVSIGNVAQETIVDYAESLVGIPYKYASTDPAEGFDCSGFITYVYNHFNIEVPRTSVDFTNLGTEISEKNARRGDLILFTGTDSTTRIVGHMGIVTENVDTLKFIHATSGKQYSVTVTPLSDYYRGRFVKVIRL